MDTSSPALRTSALGVALLIGLVIPAVVEVWSAADGRDFASFYYAALVWWDGGDPYAVEAVNAAAALDGRRQRVYPFIYPPPALPFAALWAPLGLRAGHAAMALVNGVALILAGWRLHRWLAVPLWLPALLLATSSGAIETARLGQVNGIIALLVVLAASRSSGSMLALAAVIKMSPLVLAVRWLAARALRPLLVAGGAGVTCAVLSTLVVPLDVQERFYAEVLPALSDGEWSGLGVPLSFRANHSLTGFLNTVFPGPDAHTLSTWTRVVSATVLATGLGVGAWLGRRQLDALGEGLLWGGLSALMVIAPVFSWEHHHVMLLLPMVAVGGALLAGRLPRWVWWVFGLCWAVWAWRLPWWRWSWRNAAPLRPLIEEVKLMLPIVLTVLGFWGAARSPDAVESAQE